MLTEFNIRLRICSCTLFSAMVFFAAGGNIRAAFLVSASVVTSPADNGLTRYEYQLAVGAGSTFAATDFSIDVATTAAVTAIQSPAGWTANYVSGDDLVYWNAPFDGTADLAPGATAHFTVLSPLLPSQKPYSTFGVSLENASVQLAQGTIGTPSVVPLAGDFNGNSAVDAGDYIVWRKEPAGHGGATGYNTWRAHFGQTSGLGAVATANGAVPEPTSLAMVIVAAAGVSALRRWRAC